uniref:Uncharacterized protein n=1 Tax=Solanum tuberosum TaxID=4113 RepID=M1DLP5_SOLTU
MAKTNKETEKDQILVTLLTQLDLVAKKIMELEVPDKKKDLYIPPHERIKPKEYEGGQVEEILSLIFYRVEEHNIVLNEIKENLLLLNLHPIPYPFSYSRPKWVLFCFISTSQIPIELKFRMCLKSGDWRAESPVGDSPKRSASLTWTAVGLKKF